MARTARMTLIELMVLRQDIANVIACIGKKKVFQFQTKDPSLTEGKTEDNPAADILSKLKSARSFLEVNDISAEDVNAADRPDDNSLEECTRILSAVEKLREDENTLRDELKRIQDASDEAHSFANLKVAFGDLSHMSFLTLRVGKIDAVSREKLEAALDGHAVIVSLGDNDKILAASSRKGRFALDAELKKYGFVPMEIPQDFEGVPDDVLKGFENRLEEVKAELESLIEERHNLARTKGDSLRTLLAEYSLEAQITDCEHRLESTNLVYRMTGWIAETDCHDFMTELDSLTQGRIAVRIYDPGEVPAVTEGTEKVPVKLKHGKIVRSFERMIFSYGSPLYGTIDPTPFVAVFFTVLFGIMFGDAGQGFVFLLAGILMASKVIKVGGWNKFAPIFMCIGASSMIMGFLVGEFFTNTTLLKPAAYFVTGLFGESHAPILNMEFWEAPNPLVTIFGIFGVTIGLGFIINSAGLIINFINRISRRQWGSAFFGKTGLAGALFFWYVVVFVIRLGFFAAEPQLYDWIVIGVTLFFAAFGEPFERLFDGHRPVVENGAGALVIGGIVELIEVISTYLSNSISFVRVGAFALAHAVLGFIIKMMSEKCGPVGGTAVLIIGNAIVVVLEGMIVAIQVVRLQYYEFFSKFFTETGREFVPFGFEYR